MSIGSFCLVLHGHLPYVLNHGLWPHGEDWLYEAAAETYLPILSVIDECVFFKACPKITIGLTPVLLEQLAHETFKKGFEHYLKDRIQRAGQDQAEFEARGEKHLAWLAGRWAEWYGQLSEQFARIGRDIPGAYAERARGGLIEILTSNATHGYMPLIYEDSCIRAQIRAGIASSERILGFRPTGMWLPECAYRPSGRWNPPMSFGHAKDRVGIEYLVADEGITHFFVENHLIESARSEYIMRDGHPVKVDWEEAVKYPGHGWRSVHEGHWVSSDGTPSRRVTAFARDPDICERVWSGSIGYPADGAYLEFHKKQGERRGLRYWKITGKGVDLGQKERYYPDDIPAKIHAHAQHFCQSVKDRLRGYQASTGRHGVVTACFDAELFGHWWFEGPKFIRDVILTLNADPEVELSTVAERMERHPSDKIATLPEGSWGEKGDHRVWMNDQVSWMWEVEYRCEAQFGKMTYHLPWRKNPELQGLLEKAGRELLLMQASDWPFVISRGQAVDYGIKRFVQHAARFETLIGIAEKLAEDSAYLGHLTELEKLEIKSADMHDVIYQKIDLDWWRM